MNDNWTDQDELEHQRNNQLLGAIGAIIVWAAIGILFGAAFCGLIGGL